MTAFTRLPAFPRVRARRLTICSLEHPPPPPALSSRTRFVVLSDLHVRRESADAALEALTVAHAHAVARDAGIIFLGDFWHARGALPVEPLNRVLTHLAAWQVPLVMIPGNHDLVTRAGAGVALVPLATTLGDSRCMLLTRPAVALDALWLPYCADHQTLCDALATAAALDRPPRAVFCHVEVAGARLAGSLVSRAPLRPHDFPNHTPVFSGHLHRPQVVGSVRYVGSPYQVSAAEAGQEKSLLVVDRSRGWQVVEQIPIDVGPRHFVVRFDMPFVMPRVRHGDRVAIVGARGPNGRQFVNRLRDDGVRVDLIARRDGAAAVFDDDAAFDKAAPRISSGGVSNEDLFRRYSTFKNLGEDIGGCALEILREVGTRLSNTSGKDAVVQWRSVNLCGFGTFLEQVEYPLHCRGLVLLTGSDCDNDGALSGKTNGTGKTTLAMAALWAWSGRTDPRPDGSVERGVSLEMVHDDAKECVVSVNAQLSGERVCSEVANMMSPFERRSVGLEAVDGRIQQQKVLNVVVKRTSTRVGSAAKARYVHHLCQSFLRYHCKMLLTDRDLGFCLCHVDENRSFRQGLSLVIDGIDLSCLDVRVTQARIDLLVDSTLLPHTVFFGQHMGAGRGLLDVTDRTLKDHLALIFPLDVWVEARKMCRARISKLQSMQVPAEEGLKAARAVVKRLEASESTTRDQLDLFETQREERLAEIRRRIESMISAQSLWQEDSVAACESLAPSFRSSELTAVLADLKRRIESMDFSGCESLNQMRGSAAAEVALANAAWEFNQKIQQQAEELLDKCEAWEEDRRRRVRDLKSAVAGMKVELEDLQDENTLNQSWQLCLKELNECEQELDKLVHLDVNNDKASTSVRFTNQILSLDSLKRRAVRLRDERVRLQASLQEVEKRLSRSGEFSATIAPAVQGLVGMHGDESNSIVACDKCLRPFDGDQYEKARSRLEGEASSLQRAIDEALKREELEELLYAEAMGKLSYQVDSEKTRLLTRKKGISGRLSKLRSEREKRVSIRSQIERGAQKAREMENESNMFGDELCRLGLLPSAVVEVSSLRESVTNAAKELVQRSHTAFVAASAENESILRRITEMDVAMRELELQRAEMQQEHDRLCQLQSECSQLEGDMDNVKSEANPFEESIRVLGEEQARENAIVKKKEKEVQSHNDRVEVLKAVDVAFGPRGVPSFVLEEGLMMLEQLTNEYLQKLTDGELMLQIRAFSDYKSSRVDGENKEVISKRIFARDERNGELRERALRQLSGGQRRRCSLAFAFAFADLAHERAGLRSSLMVLDEILQALDQDGRLRIANLIPELIKGANSRRDTVVVVAQDEAPELAGLADGGIDVVERSRYCARVVVDAYVGGEASQS